MPSFQGFLQSLFEIWNSLWWIMQIFQWPLRDHSSMHCMSEGLWDSVASLKRRHNGRDGVSIIVYSGAGQRKHQSSASLAFVWGIHRWPVNSPHKWPVTRKIFHVMTSLCCGSLVVFMLCLTRYHSTSTEENIGGELNPRFWADAAAAVYLWQQYSSVYHYFT